MEWRRGTGVVEAGDAWGRARQSVFGSLAQAREWALPSVLRLPLLQPAVELVCGVARGWAGVEGGRGGGDREPHGADQRDWAWRGGVERWRE